MKELRPLIYLLIVIVGLVLSGCSTPTSVEEETIDITFNINLPLDSNGYYVLQMDTSKSQTLHRVSGFVTPSIENKRIEWRSNLYSYYNTIRMATTNERSYTDDDGVFYNMIGPLRSMKGDTMMLDVQWDDKLLQDSIRDYEPNHAKRFYIILK